MPTSDDFAPSNESVLPPARGGSGIPDLLRDDEGGCGRHIRRAILMYRESSSEQRKVMERFLRTVLNRVEFTQNEIHLLRGVVKALARGGA